MAGQALRSAVAALAATTPACGDGGDGGDDTVPCEAITLAGDASDHELPSGYAAGGFLGLGADVACGADGTPSYATVDLTGDDVLDLVVTRLCGDDAVGSDHWLVHPGGQDGFAVDPVEWQLPAGYIAGGFRAIGTAAACGADGTPSYATTDLTGDGAPDLVVTRVCGDATVGDAVWRVHPGGGDGFGDATDWSLPGGYIAGGFLGTGAVVACGADGTPSYGLADLDRDDRLDLVVTRVCGDAAVGDTRWRLHAGGGDGFASSPSDWGLPSGYATGAFLAAGAVVACGADGTPSYGLVDLDGDRGLDLVVTRVCGDAAVGDAQWRRHPGGEGGFGAAEPWRLPDEYTAGAFLALGTVAACGADGTPSFAAGDVDGDRIADLVITRVCGDAAIGDARWVVHAGGGEGFGAAADVPLPGGYAAGAFAAVATQAACGADGTPSYGLTDLDGDGRPDLIVTRLCGDAAVGDRHWKVHPSRCQP